MAALFMSAPNPWRDLGDVLETLGHEVYGLWGGRPTYNWFPRFMALEQEYREMRKLLHLSWSGAVDVEKSCLAVAGDPWGDAELQERLNDLPHQLARGYALRKAVAGVLADKDCAAAVVTCSYDPLGRTVVGAAQDAGVPVVHVAHACQTAAPGDAWYAARAPGDVVCVPGERDHRWWAECLGGTGKTVLEVTGHPLWDEHWRRPVAQTPAVPTVLWACESGANAAQTPRLWATREVPERAWGKFLSAVKGLRGYHRDGASLGLILKVRDGEDGERVEAWANEARDVLGDVLVTRDPVGEVVPQADVVVCQDSNLGVEALILGVPVVTITRDGGCLFDPLRGGSVQQVQSGFGIAALRDLIRGQLDHPPLNREAIREEAARYCRPGGVGMAEVVRVIGEVANRADVAA